MKEREIVDFLSELTGRKAKTQLINGWVSTGCPLSRWTHERGHDEHPSFGVKVRTDGEVSIFNCYTCKRKGPLSRLARLYGELSGEDVSHLIDDAEDLEVLGPNLPLWEDLGELEPHEQAAAPLGDEYNDIYEDAIVDIEQQIVTHHTARGGMREVDLQIVTNVIYIPHPYLEERNISGATTKALDIKYDPDDGHGVERIVFPVRGLEGELYGYTGRAIDPDVEPRIRDYYGLNKRQCLLGIDKVNDRGPVVLVEGLFDYAYVRECGFHAVAAMHSALTEPQAALLRDLGKPVVLMYDNDEAGRSGAKQAKRLLHQYVSCQKVKYPGPTSRRADRPKDPAECSPDQLRWMMANTRLA